MNADACYVLTNPDNRERAIVLVQIPASNQWGFELADDDQTWPGGFGIASEWEALEDDDPRITDEDRERLGWLLDEAREQP